MDSDGDADLVATNLMSAGGPSLLSNKGDGAFEPARSLPPASQTFFLKAGDADGDGDLDLVVTGFTGMSLVANRGGGVFEDKPLNDHGLLKLELADLNFDRLPEISFPPAYEGNVLVYANERGSFAEPVAFEIPPGPSGLAPGGAGGSGDPSYAAATVASDLDGDAKPDLALAFLERSQVLVLYNRTRPGSPDENSNGVPDECDGPGTFSIRRGDPNRDGEVDISDAVTVLRHLFLTAEPIPCRKEADSNDDGRVDVSDAVAILQFLYLGADPLPAPYPGCGPDPTPDGVDCGSFLECP
ncbi:MAG: VCBS repeat-containing protein [Planctomycetes bacterium]|nr:VCBS repeat-containing protein [Planctomycetota bacterium]